MTKITRVTNIAAERAIDDYISTEAERLYDKLIINRFKYLDEQNVFEPTYFDCMCKSKFYANGGNPIRPYSIESYADLLDVPADVVAKWVESRPAFFVWLHEKRDFQNEMEDLCIIAARQMINNFRGAGLRDKAQALNTLSRFTGLVSPKKSDHTEIDDIISRLSTPEEVTKLMKEHGFIKTKEDEEEITNNYINADLPTDNSESVEIISGGIDLNEDTTEED